MADVNAPSGQAPAMAPPIRTDDQILPRIRWVPNGKSNCYLDLEKSQAGSYMCQLDEQWFVVTKDTLREALQITPINNNQPFVAPPLSDTLINFVNELGYPKLVRNVLNGIVKQANIDYAERIWEEFVQSIHTFIEDKSNLSRRTTGKKRATLIVIPSIRFTKLIIHHLQRRHKFHPRPDSLLHLSNEEHVLGYLKFSAKGTKREDSPAPKPTKPARKPKSTAPKAPPRHAVSTPVTSAQPAPTSAPAMPQEKKRKQATETSDKPPKAKKSKYSHRGGIRKGMLEADEGGQSECQAGPDPGAQAEGQIGSDAGAQDEGQAGSHPDETSEGQAGETLQLDEGFTATAYPKVQENLKLAVEEHVLLEDPASSSGTLSSPQHLSRDISFGDLFFSDKPSDTDKNAKTEVESMVNIPIQQALSSISLMTSPILDLTSRPESPKLFEALEKSMNRDHSEELAQDLAEARKKKKKSRESPKTPPGSPPPPPLPARPSEASGAPGASESSQMPPPPPPSSSTNPESPSKGSAAPSSSKTAASAEYQAWTTTDIRLRPSISLNPADLEINEDMAPDEQVQSSDDEDVGSAHILMVNLRQDWWKPFKEERPATLEPAWSIRSSDVLVPTNTWASALASNYLPPPADSLLAQTGDIATFMDWFCKRRGITELKPQDLEGPAYEIVKVFHPDVIHLQYQMEECHKLLTNSVDDPILRHNVSKPLPLGGPPGQVTIQSDFFFNKDLKYLSYDSKGRRPALSISKMKAAYYPDAGLEQMVPDQFWINEKCKYDIAAMYGISHWWFQRQQFYIDRHTSERDRSAVRTHMRILSVIRIEVFSMYGYDYMKKIVLRRADLNEHFIAKRDFKYLYPSDFEDLLEMDTQETDKNKAKNDKTKHKVEKIGKDKVNRSRKSKVKARGQQKSTLKS
nr:hypothetical protein [Tanacetum cinerariifolium]